MKIERINENQIRCTLSRSDLASHQIKISELAYGSEKTRDLFEDMMNQAFEECGFDASDLPVMIETIPVSMDCIILMITKVEEPDEIDTAFSGLMNWDDVISGVEEDGIRPLRDILPQPVSKSLERIFSFDDLDRVIDLAHCVGGFYRGLNTLFRNPADGKYYVILTNSGCTASDFGCVLNAASEYGSKDPSGFAKGAFIKEHFDVIIRKKALQKLANV